MKYPDIHVQLVGKDGNAFAIIGACTKAARRAHVIDSDIKKFQDEAMSGDYDHLLRTCMEWFNVE